MHYMLYGKSSLKGYGLRINYVGLKRTINIFEFIIFSNILQNKDLNFILIFLQKAYISLIIDIFINKIQFIVNIIYISFISS